MMKISETSYKKGRVILEEIKFDHVFRRKVTRSGTVGKIYLPKELIGKNVYIIVDMNGLNGIQERQDKESVKKPEPVATG